MKNYAEEKRLFSQPQKMLISGFTLQSRTFSTPLLLFYLQLGFVWTKIHHFVEYTPRKCFNSFVQSAVDARRQGDEIPNSSVVAKTMKLLANSSYGYQIMDRSQHTVTKYLSDEKTHSAIKSNLFNKLDHVNNALYEVELAKAQIEHKEPIIVGFLIPQYAKLRMLELHYILLPSFVMEASSKSQKRTLIQCILLLRRRNWKTVYDLKWKRSGSNCGQKVVPVDSLLMPSEIHPSPPNVLWQAQKNWQARARSFQRGVQVFGNAASLQ